MVIKNPQYNIGTDVSDTTATPADVLSPKKFHQVDGQLVTGTISTYAGATVLTNNGEVAHTAGTYVENDISVNISTPITGDEDVVFYDYDGTPLYAYSAAEFLALNEMPANPSHDGLVADGWNWTLADAQQFVQANGKVDIGQCYHTTSGYTEIDIELNKATELTVTFFSAFLVDWGDGTTDSTGTHTYADYGKYTIKTSRTSFGNFNYVRLLSTGNWIITAIRFAAIFTTIYQNALEGMVNCEYITRPAKYCLSTNSSFRYAYKLKCIILYSGETIYQVTNVPNLKVVCTTKSSALQTAFSITSPPNYNSIKRIIISSGLTSVGAVCQSLTNLKEAILAEGITEAGYGFRNCYNLSKIKLPTSMDTLYATFANCMNLEEIDLRNLVHINSDAFNWCVKLKKIKFPPSIVNIGNNAFGSCYGMELYDFTDMISIPTLGTNAFAQISRYCKIVVPDALYESWIVATNWASYANYIYKASEVQL